MPYQEEYDEYNLYQLPGIDPKYLVSDKKAQEQADQQEDGLAAIIKVLGLAVLGVLGTALGIAVIAAALTLLV